MPAQPSRSYRNWSVTNTRKFGRRLAERPEISHCYRRPALEDFPYNLFAMIHGRSADEVREVATQAAERLALSDYDVLFSTAEYKKESMRYFTEPCGR